MSDPKERSSRQPQPRVESPAAADTLNDLASQDIPDEQVKGGAVARTDAPPPPRTRAL